jgi:PAS domain S-box-containing protein
MSYTADKATEVEMAELEASRGRPLSNLSEAIDALRSACSRLQVSVKGINSDLEDTNRKLTTALDLNTETARYLENILASIPSGVIVVDKEGRVVIFNDAAQIITGYRSEDVLGRLYSKTFGCGVPKKNTPLYTLASGCSIEHEEKTLRTPSGKTVAVGFSTSLLMNGESRISGAIEVLTDMRRVKLLEEEVSRARTLATIGEVAAVVAHEVRNPLGGIKGFASLLERDLADNPEGLALLRQIREGIDSLDRIVTDLLEAGRDTKLRFQHFDLASEIRRLVDMFGMAARGEGKRIGFAVEISEEPFFCCVDRDRIRQAATNLMRNACEAVGEEGTITIRVYSKSQGSDPTGSMREVRSLRDYACIEVNDTGPGISKDMLEKVFAPFFTTKDTGTGLGLSTVRRVAALHGGEVKYLHPESGGSRFTIEIPRW